MNAQFFKAKVRGLRGENQADILRRTGRYGVLPTDTDEQAMAKLNAAAEAAAVRSEAAAAAADVDAQTAAMAAQSVLDNLADIDKTSALQFQAVSRGALAAIANQFDGMQAYLSEKGREGAFIWTPGDQTAIVAGDPRQAVSVAPSSDTTGAAGAWLRRYPKGQMTATWFGAVGDGVVDEANNTATGTDDTAAIQAGWDFMAANGGGRMVYPDGVYIIAGDFKTAGGVNAQLVLPFAGDVADEAVIALSGVTPPALSGGTNKGAILVSTKTTVPDNNQIWSLVGCRNPNGDQSRSWLSFYFDNMIFRVPQNSRISGLDLRYVHQYGSQRYRIDVIGGFGNAALGGTNGVALQYPSQSLQYGLIGPLIDIPLWGAPEEGLIFGYHQGFFVGELTRAGKMCISGCDTALVFPPQRHPSKFEDVLVLSCVRGIQVVGDHMTTIELFNTEHTPLPPSFPARGPDIDDPQNRLRGKMSDWHIHEEPFTQVVVGGTNFKIEQASFPVQQAAGSYSRYFPGFQDATDSSGITQTLNDRGRIAWRIVGTKQASNTGTIGVDSYVNLNLTGPDFRVAQTRVDLDGAQDAGTYVIATRLAGGALRDQVKFDSKGNIIVQRADNHLNAPLGGDIAGSIAIAAGQSASAAKNFNRTYGAPPVVIVTPTTPLPSGTSWYVDRSATQFLVKLTAALPAGTSASFDYFVMGG